MNRKVSPWVFSLVITWDKCIYSSSSNRYVQSRGTVTSIWFVSLWLLESSPEIYRRFKPDFKTRLWALSGSSVMMREQLRWRGRTHHHGWGLLFFFFSQRSGVNGWISPAEDDIWSASDTHTHITGSTQPPLLFFFIDIDSPVVSHLKRMSRPRRGALLSTRVWERREVTPKQE